jgi:hypothetical protein
MKGQTGLLDLIFVSVVGTKAKHLLSKVGVLTDL